MPEMTELARHYELIEDDPDFGMVKGDVLACVPYPHDGDKLTVCFRVADLYDPSCNVYREQVRRVEGETPIRWKAEAPYGAEPCMTSAAPDPKRGICDGCDVIQVVSASDDGRGQFCVTCLPGANRAEAEAEYIDRLESQGGAEEMQRQQWLG
jgi:hypothetical protein